MKNKSLWPDGFSGEILKLGVEALIPYIVRLLGIKTNKVVIPNDWKRAIVVPIYKGRDRSVVATTVPSA
jgi:hypothetical protein